MSTNVIVPDRASGQSLPAPPGTILDGASLFLDFDGTLVDIAPTPAAVVVDAPLVDLLQRLAIRMEGRLALISGRPIADLVRLFGRPPCALAGSHGLELAWPDGRRSEPLSTISLGPVVAEIIPLRGRYPGILIEKKPFGVAIHYRAAPAAEADCRRLATELAAASDLTVQSGKMVIELRMPGADKGSAVRVLLGGATTAAIPVFIGDDDTDEAGFIVAAELSGAGILVGAPRPTAAAYRLESVAATRAWLDLACGLSA